MILDEFFFGRCYYQVEEISLLSIESLYHEKVLGFVKYVFFASVEMIMYTLCFNQLKN